MNRRTTVSASAQSGSILAALRGALITLAVLGGFYFMFVGLAASLIAWGWTA